MYNDIIGVDDEIWDIIEDGISFAIDYKRMVIYRKSLSDAQRKIYRKHHRVCSILVEAFPHSEYIKIVDKSIAKSIF